MSSDRGVVAVTPRLAGRRLVLPPPVLVPVQQGRDPGAGGEADCPLGLARVHFLPPGVAAGLERVLPFQPQLRGQGPQADAVAAEFRLVAVAGGDPAGARPAVQRPAGPLGAADPATGPAPQSPRR